MASNARVVSRTNDVFSNNTYSDINKILDTFANISGTEEANSVISSAFNKLIKTRPEVGYLGNYNFYNAVFNTLNGTQTTSNLSYVPTNKSSRLAEYERMARNSEIDACLDEIADAAINFNEKKQCVEIVFNDLEYVPHNGDTNDVLEMIDKKQDILYKEFYKFINPLKLKNKLHRYVKTFLKTGECCWENVINVSDPSLGIIDFEFLPSYSYDFAYDKNTREKVGIWVRVLSTKAGSAMNFDVSAGNVPAIGNYTSTFSGTSYNLSNFNRYEDYTAGDLMFLPFDQITYVESNEHSPDELIVYPLIEKARRAFNQLMCVEDAIIIYRLARAPTRLVFNVGVGMANNSKGAQQVQQLIRRYNVAKTYNPTTGSVTNTRDPHTMTESFWFMKSANGEGTDVSELSSSIDMGELPDLRYFQKKLWSALHIPAKRFTDSGEALSKNPANEMTAEEYKFCKFVIRILANFSDAIKDSFITHLKLTGLYDNLEIDPSFFDIHFVNPLSYELYEQSRILMQRIEMFKAVVEDGETFSKTVAMKKYLNFTNDEVKENWMALEEEMINKKYIEAKSDAIVEVKIEKFKEALTSEGSSDEESGDEEGASEEEEGSPFGGGGDDEEQAPSHQQQSQQPQQQPPAQQSPAQPPQPESQHEPEPEKPSPRVSDMAAAETPAQPQ